MTTTEFQQSNAEELASEPLTHSPFECITHWSASCVCTRGTKGCNKKHPEHLTSAEPASDLATRLRSHVAQMASHQRERRAGKLIVAAAVELHAAEQAACYNSDVFDSLVSRLADLLKCEKNAAAVIAATTRMRQDVEFMFDRLAHICFIHDNPESVQAGFGMGETMKALAEKLPNISERYKHFCRTPSSESATHDTSNNKSSGVFDPVTKTFYPTINQLSIKLLLIVAVVLLTPTKPCEAAQVVPGMQLAARTLQRPGND